MSPMVSAVCLSLLAAPGYAFVQTPFVAEQVRHSPAAQTTARSTPGARTTTRMVATPDKVGSGVKRNENFAKLKVGGCDLLRVGLLFERFCLHAVLLLYTCGRW